MQPNDPDITPTSSPPSPATSTSSESSADVESSLIISRLRQRLFKVHSPTQFGPKGRYLIEDRKGSGGMANVYKAHDNHLGVTVALKLLRTDLWRAGSGSPQDGQRLIREARSLAMSSRAAHVARVYDAAEYEGGYYISMEYIDGVDLRRFQSAAGRTQRELIDTYLEAGRGLAELHRAGLVHLDFKPENVVVEAAEGRPRRAVLVDLGLAVRIGEARPDLPALSGAEVEYSLYAFGGTPAYAAPERLAGREFDARADQFSYCVAFYEALFRSHPFFGATIEQYMSTSRDERPQIAESTLRLKYVHDVQAAISQGRRAPVPRELRLPWGLLAALERGMSPDPSRRYASMDELLRALTRGRRIAAVVKKIVLPAAACLALGGLGAHQYIQATLCTGFVDRVAAVWSKADADGVRAAFEGAPVAETVIAALDDFSADWTATQTEACEEVRKSGRHSEQWLDRRTHCLDRALGVVAEVRRKLVTDRATGQVGPERLTLLGDLLAACDADGSDTGAPLLRADDPLVQRLDALTAAEVLDPLVEVRRDAEQLLAEAEQRGEPTLIAEAAFRLARVLGQLRTDPVDGPANLEAADAALARAIEAAGEARRPTLAAAALVFRLKLRAAAIDGPGDTEQLAERLDEAQGLVEAMGALRLQAEVAETEGIRLLGIQAYDQARDALRTSVELREQLLAQAKKERREGADLSLRVPLAKTLNNLGEVYNQAERYPEARATFERALVEWRAVAGESSVYTLETRLNLLQALQDMGDDAAAEAERRGIAEVLASRRIGDPYAVTRDRALQVRWDLILAQASVDAKRHREALQILETLLSRQLPEMKRSEAQLLRAEACSGLRDWACVREAANTVITIDAGDPSHLEEARTLLAEANAASGSSPTDPP